MGSSADFQQAVNDVEVTWTLPIPAGAVTGTLNLQGLSQTDNGQSDFNENTLTGEIFIDIDANTTTGTLSAFRVSNPDLFAFSNLPNGTRLIDDVGGTVESNRTDLDDTVDDITGTLAFEIVTNPDGSRDLLVTCLLYTSPSPRD